jgi:hypothetical protein
MRSWRSWSLVSRAVYMSSMLPIRSFTFIEAGASLVGQRAALPVGAGPRGARPARLRVVGAGPVSGGSAAAGPAWRLVFVAGGAVSGGRSGSAPHGVMERPCASPSEPGSRSCALVHGGCQRRVSASS